MSKEKPIAVVKPTNIKSSETEKKFDPLWLDLWYEERWICVDAFDAKMRERPEEFVIISP